MTMKLGGRPPLLQVRSSTWFITFTVSFAVFLDTFLYGMIVPVAPTALDERIGLRGSQKQQWISILLALYGISGMVVSPILGHFADRSASRRWPFMLGLLVMASSSVMLCAGTRIWWWVVARILQGISTAVVWTVGLALLVDTVGKENLCQAIGYVGMALGIGNMAGPLLGGILYQERGYYAVWCVSFALIGIDVVLRMAVVEKKHAVVWLGTASAPKLDDGEKVLVSTQVRPLSHGVPVLSLLASGHMLAGLWGFFLISFIMTAFDGVLPLFVEETFSWKQLGQGLIIIPLCLPHAFEPGIGAFVDRYLQYRQYFVAGEFIFVVGPIVLLRFVTHDSVEQKVLLSVLLFLVGFCMAAASPAVLSEFSRVVDAKEAKQPGIFGPQGATAQAYGLMNSAFSAGATAGPLFAGFIRDQSGWDTMTWALALWSASSFIPMLFLLGDWKPYWRKENGITHAVSSMEQGTLQ